MLSLIDDRLTQLEAQQGVTYRGGASIYGILKRMDRLLYMGVNSAEVLTKEHRVLKIPEANMGLREGKSGNPHIRFHQIYFTDCQRNMNTVTLKNCYYKFTCAPKHFEVSQIEGFVMKLLFAPPLANFIIASDKAFPLIMETAFSLNEGLFPTGSSWS